MEDQKTKIIATIGPSSDSSLKIKKLVASGVDLFRFNTKHSTIEWHNQRIKKAQSIAAKEGRNIGIMVDLQGNEIRVETKNQKPLTARKNSCLLIGGSFFSKDVSVVISDLKIFKKIKRGSKIFIDNGLIELKVIGKTRNSLSAKVVEGGIIKHRKSVNFPDAKMKLSSLIKKDIESLDSAAKNKVTFIALSFVQSRNDIRILRKEMQKRGMAAAIISKIENRMAIDNIDQIIDESDAVMVARGDLGIEIPIEELAYWQKEIIKKCRLKRKPVIVATQMLHSMTRHARPTRAEATDVANAVLDGTDAVMLSEETALGKYPIKSVTEMSKILSFNEKNARFDGSDVFAFNPTEFVVGAIAGELKKEKALDRLKVKAAIVFTESGYTARVLSSFRLNIKIIAVTNNKKTAEKLSLSHGITPYCAPIKFDNLELPSEIMKDLQKKNLVSKKETVAVFHGRYNKKPNLLNLFSLTKLE